MASVNSQCVRQSLLSSVYFRANRGCARRKIFKMEVLRRLKNTVFRMVVVNTADVSFNYTFFQQLYRYYVALTSSKITRLGRCIDPILPEFSQVSKVGGVTPPTPACRYVPSKVLLFNFQFPFCLLGYPRRCVPPPPLCERFLRPRYANTRTLLCTSLCNFQAP